MYRIIYQNYQNQQQTEQFDSVEQMNTRFNECMNISSVQSVSKQQLIDGEWQSYVE